MPKIGLFPGQGAQCIGMLRHSLTLPSVQSLCKLAADTLGYDLSAVCQLGPQDKLNKTEFCQPATLLASLSSHRMFGGTLAAVAGFSVGEISALVVAKSVSERDAFLFVKQRAEAMQTASERFPSAMLSVSGISTATIQTVLEKSNRDIHGDAQAVIANFLSESTHTISVAKNDVRPVSDRLSDAGARNVKLLPVSGGFHSQFMRSASEKIREVVNRIDIQLPEIPVYSNITAEPYRSVVEIRNSLILQMTQPVQWYGIMKRLIETHRNVEFVELGYGNQLLSLLSRIDRKSYKLATHFAP